MKHIILTAALLGAALAPATAQQDDAVTTGLEITEAEQAAAVQFAIENMRFALLHEAGHLLLSEFEIPPSEQTEPVADRFAALRLLAEPEGGVSALLASADGWSWSAGEQTGGQADGAYLDVHNPDGERAKTLSCLMMGQSPAAFAASAALFSLDATQQDRCTADFAGARTAEDELFGLFRRGARPELTEAVDTRYEAGGAYQLIADALERGEVLETSARAVNAEFAFARPITFVASVCDQENAFTDPEDGSVTLCYELADAFVRLYVDNVLLGNRQPTSR